MQSWSTRSRRAALAWALCSSGAIVAPAVSAVSTPTAAAAPPLPVSGAAQATPRQDATGEACQDTVRPGLPVFGPASLPVGTWVNDNRLDLQWTPATDDSCGVDGYGERWTALPADCPESVKHLEATQSALTVTLPDGTWYYTLKTLDLAGNWSVDCARAGPFQIDTTPPGPPDLLSSNTHLAGGWSRLDRIAASWRAPSDPTSGVAGYAVTVTQGGGALPPEQIDVVTADQYLSDPQPEQGQLYVNVRAVDHAGNWGPSFATLGPLGIDMTPPSDPVSLTSDTHTVGVRSDSRVVIVDWPPCTDALSGVRGYSVLWSQVADDSPSGVVNSLPPQAESPLLVNGSWWLHVQAVDLAGGRSAATHMGPFVIGVPPPSPPQVSSTSHLPGSCKADCTIEATWRLVSGAVAYSIEWSQSATTVPDTLIDTVVRLTLSPCLATGTWYLHVRAVNGAQAWSDASHAGPFPIDISPPLAPATLTSSTHQPDRWSPHRTVSFAMDGAGDEGCGLGGYSLVIDRDATTIPDTAVDLQTDQAVSGELTEGGAWYLHVCSIDEVGNRSPETRHLGPLWIDATPPTVTLASPSGDVVLEGGGDVPILFSVDDVLSGVHASRVQASLDGGATWDVEIARDIPPGGEVVWRVPNLRVAAARLRVVTVDRAGNTSLAENDGNISIEPTSPPPPLPVAYALHPNAPNPFNPATSIAFDLPAPGAAQIQILDLRGRWVVTLWDGWREAGSHRVAWDGRDGDGRPLPSGVYVCRMRAGAYSASRTLSILR